MFRRDLGLYLLIGGYCVSVFVLARAFGAPARFRPIAEVVALARSILFGLAVLVIWSGVRALQAANPARAFRDNLGAPQELAGVAMTLALAVFLSAFGSMKALLPHISPFWADPMLSGLDRALHGAQDPWRYLPRDPTLTHAVDLIYEGGWTLALAASMAVAAFSRQAWRAQYLWTFVLAWILLGNLVAGAMMSAGPIYFEAVTGSAHYRALFDDVAANAPAARMAREQLWRIYLSGGGGMGAGISAFPSLHLSTATLFVLQARRIDPRLAAVAVGFGGWTMASAVYLGWHYAIDGYFSILATVLLWKGVGFALARRSERMVLQPVAA